MSVRKCRTTPNICIFVYLSTVFKKLVHPKQDDNATNMPWFIKNGSELEDIKERRNNYKSAGKKIVKKTKDYG